MSTGGDAAAPASPTSPTSPGGYYFDDDDEGEGKDDATSTGMTFGASITANANKLASSLADGLSRFRLRASNRASADASDADVDVAANE
jgi:hypothetical protein